MGRLKIKLLQIIKNVYHCVIVTHCQKQNLIKEKAFRAIGCLKSRFVAIFPFLISFVKQGTD